MKKIVSTVRITKDTTYSLWRIFEHIYTVNCITIFPIFLFLLSIFILILRVVPSLTLRIFQDRAIARWNGAQWRIVKFRSSSILHLKFCPRFLPTIVLVHLLFFFFKNLRPYLFPRYVTFRYILNVIFLWK